MKKTLGLSKKVLEVKAVEATGRNAEEKLHDFFDIIVNYDVSRIHWFDESSVVQTSGNRKYGYGPIGERTFEFQKYASSATYTINLLVSKFGPTYHDILEGPSNGFAMLDFFEVALQVTNELGNNALAHGDVVVMDNCGFHHARHVEGHLRQMLRQRNIELVFQPPYSPQFNVCEMCFNHIKDDLKRNPAYTAAFTELAILDAVDKLSPAICSSYARHCGYV